MDEREIISKIRRLEKREKVLYRLNRLFRYNTGEKIHKKQPLYLKPNLKPYDIYR